VRQLCNVAYATLAEGRDENELEELDMALGMITDPADVAKAALRKYQEEMGMVFEDPDAPVAPMTENLDGEIRGERW
jgi:hypothetical protein